MIESKKKETDGKFSTYHDDEKMFVESTERQSIHG
jgi:hypothetical protein